MKLNSKPSPSPHYAGNPHKLLNEADPYSSDRTLQQDLQQAKTNEVRLLVTVRPQSNSVQSSSIQYFGRILPKNWVCVNFSLWVPSHKESVKMCFNEVVNAQE